MINSLQISVKNMFTTSHSHELYKKRQEEWSQTVTKSNRFRLHCIDKELTGVHYVALKMRRRK